MHIDIYKDTIEKWKNCPMANYVCPVARATKVEANTPRGKAFILSLVKDELVKINENIVIDRIYQCGLCKACEAIGRDNTSIPELILAARKDIADMGSSPEYAVDLKEEIYSKSKLLDKRWVKETANQIKSSSKNIVLITYESKYSEKSYSALMSILDTIGIKVIKINLGKFPAPAALLNELGYYEDSKLALDNILHLIDIDKIEKFIFMTPYDLELFKNFISGDLELNKIQHSFEFLDGLIKSNSIKISKNLKEEVIYFDFCSPRNLDSFYEIPRRILSLIPDIKVKEMIWTKKESTSTGGLALPYTFPDIVQKINIRILDEVKRLDAKMLVVPCTHCIDNITSIRNSTRDLKIIDLWELISLVL